MRESRAPGEHSLKMKLVAAVFFVATLGVSLFIRNWGALLPFVFGAAFGVYGIARSTSARINKLNDVPNAFRVFLASLGGFLTTVDRVFIFPSVGLLLLAAGLFLNDEYQRRALHSLRTGRRGGSVALLGIDGSGKSTHSEKTSGWFEERGYRVELMPFHRYLFVERLSSVSRTVRSGATARKMNPLRPVLSLVDNLLLQISSSIGSRVEGTVVIYDRFIWSTYIKYEALGYPVEPLSSVYLLPRPRFAIILDVPVEKSLRVIDERVAHIHYPRSVLEHERNRYLDIARRYGYPVVDATASFDEVQTKIERFLSPLFPAAGRRR
jgi:dTMP kinase